MSDTELLNWLDNCDESFVSFHRLFGADGTRYSGVGLCSKQTEPFVKAKNVREAIKLCIKESNVRCERQGS